MSAAIIIPQTSQVLPNEGTIVAVGAWCRGPFRVGDWIMFAPDTDVSIKVDGVRYLLIREKDLLGVIE